MRRFRLTLVLMIVVASLATAQGSYHMMRYEDDYEYLRDSSRRTWYEHLKFSPLNKSSRNYLSAGGEVRYQYFNFHNEDWGDAPGDKDGFVLTRFLFHSDLHFSKALRVFMQIQGSNSDGRVEGPIAGEQNELDLHQAFVDVSLLHTSQAALMLRVGRQEMSYGASRLVSVREGPNNRQSFDAAKLLYAGSKMNADLFLADHVTGRPGIFNDEVLAGNTRFWGTYFTFNKIPAVGNLDLYYLGINKENSKWNDINGRELRHSVGARVHGVQERITYDIEGVYQFGELSGSKISAWTMSSNIGLRITDREESSIIGLKTELISGDKRSGDDKINSFNPLFPRGAYFGYAALIGPSNLFDIHPSWTVPISKSFEADLDYDIFWRYSSSDGIYNQNAFMMYPAGSGSRYIGQQLSGNIEYVGNDHLFIRTEITWFKVGDYVRSVSAGKDIFFIGVTTRFRF